MATSNGTQNKHSDMLKQADADGKFRRQDAQFRNWISADPSSPFPAEKDRYVLYINWGCPWAHRANIVRSLKGLEDIIQLSVMDFELTQDGWVFNGREGSDPADPLYGFKFIRDLYHKADPTYNLRYTVPMLWDKKNETIVSNESSEIIRMFYTEFDALLPADRREEALQLFPKHLRPQIEEMNEWVYHTINNGVYKTGFASTQEAYDENVYPIFESLDRIEKMMSEPGHSPFLFGDHVTEADIRLYPTLIRFDTAYHTIFRCNLKMIRHDYPNIHLWLRRLYWDRSEKTNGGVFGKTTYVAIFKRGYVFARKQLVVPAGPKPDVIPLEDMHMNGS